MSRFQFIDDTRTEFPVKRLCQVLGINRSSYNHHRKHSSLGYLAPVDYARQCTHHIDTDDSQSVRTE